MTLLWCDLSHGTFTQNGSCLALSGENRHRLVWHTKKSGSIYCTCCKCNAHEAYTSWHAKTGELFLEWDVKDVLYSMFGPDLLGLTVTVQNIVGWCFSYKLWDVPASLLSGTPGVSMQYILKSNPPLAIFSLCSQDITQQFEILNWPWK